MMTKAEKLFLLKKDKNKWNTWRKNYSIKDIDLREIELNNTNLQYINFSHTNLSFSNFTNSNLDHANLKNANLHKTKFTNANLSKSDLRNAKFNNSELSNANLRNTKLDFVDLRNANLKYTNLSYAKFRQTNLSYANFNYTILTGVNLRNVIGLEKVQHLGPSIIDTTTFQKSMGQIPEEFLKGCGLSDWEIASVKLYNPKLTPTEVTDIFYKMDELRNEKPLQFHNLFISYNHRDAAFVDVLEKYLDAKGIRFWRDVHDAPAGRLDKIVLREMKDRTVLVLFSENSVNSDWVEFEIENARRLEKEQGRDVLCPIALDDSWKNCDWHPKLMNQITKYNILDFSDWEDESAMGRQFDKLLKGLDLFYKK